MTKTKHINKDWNVGELRLLGRYLRAGLTYNECAKLLDVTRNAIIGIVNRHKLQLTTEQALERKQRANYERTKGGRAPQWNAATNERRFIEPWTEYSARKRAERAALRKASLNNDPDVSGSPET